MDEVSQGHIWICDHGFEILEEDYDVFERKKYHFDCLEASLALRFQ